MHTGKLIGRIFMILVVIFGTLLLFSGIMGVVRAEIESFIL